MKTFTYNERLVIWIDEEDRLYLQGIQSNIQMKEVWDILSTDPGIEVLQFKSIGEVCGKSTISEKIEFGRLKNPIEILIAPNKMSAEVVFYFPVEKLSIDNRGELQEKLEKALEKAGVVFGIKWELLQEPLIEAKVKYNIAQGKAMKRGLDSVVSMREIKTPQPSVKEDDTVDFFDMNYIEAVEIGDVCGERTEPTKGEDGYNVLGQVIPAIPGRVLPFPADMSVFKENFSAEQNKTLLTAKVNGALSIEKGKYILKKHLYINGDVDFKTGNIKFDGSVTIKGTILDNFSVVAKDDIEILAPLGLGAVKEVISKEGSVFIRGGVAGKGRANIEAKEDIVVKFGRECQFKCEGIVYIASALMDCKIEAKKVILSAPNSKIIGGEIIAEMNVQSGTIGSRMTDTTNVTIKGFKRKELEEKYTYISNQIIKCDNEIDKTLATIQKFEQMGVLGPQQIKEFQQTLQRLDMLERAQRQLKTEKANCTQLLRVKGEGSVEAIQAIYPLTNIRIKDASISIKNEIQDREFYYVNRELRRQ